MSLRFARSLSSTARTLGAWAEFQNRAASLKIADETVRKSIFEGLPASGPKTNKSPQHREAYHSPELIDETFSQAYQLLQAQADQQYQELESRRSEMTTSQLDAALVAAEELNPEVLYNARYAPAVDRDQPVYRKFLEQRWKAHDLMVTMQRLEQLHVIPDTLPTLEPRVDVKVKFAHNTSEEFSSWVVPGTRMPAAAVSRPPTIEVQEFSAVDGGSGLYTVVVVNPDEPDVARNTFRTRLHYGLCNVPLTFSDNTISAGKLVQNPELVFAPYTPLVPEKNAPTQRACVWVFRQPAPLQVQVSAENFDIRAFVETYGLDAVGAHVWRQDFDRSVADVRAKYGLPEGRVFDPVRGTTPL